MTNCPNCGAPLEPYKCKCEFCGTWYFDFTAFDMSDDKPYYVKFRTPYGVITTLAIPKLKTIETFDDTCYAVDGRGNNLCYFIRSRSCDLDVVFHSIANPEDGNLFKLEVGDK